MAKKTGTVPDKASGRLVPAGPEEVDATQPLLEALIEECGWLPGQIASRPQWRVSPSPSDKRKWPVDVAIFESPQTARMEDHIRIICECKRPDEATGVQQLKTYLDREPHARVGVWFNGTDHAIIYKVDNDYVRAPLGTPLPRPGEGMHLAGRPPLAYPDLRKAPSLVPLFRRIRNRLAAQDTEVNRDEHILPDLSTLLLLKILDEQANRLAKTRPLMFQVAATREATANKVVQFLQDQVAQHADIFGGTAVDLAIDHDSIAYVVEELQNYKLLSNDDDAIASAFQVIRGKAYKGEEGQYFTPPSVVRLAVAAVNPTSDDRVIDPACGSGSFLAAALHHVVEQLADAVGRDTADFGTAKKDWSAQNLFGIDKDSVSVRLSKSYLSLLGDGSTHIYRADALRPSLWKERGDNLHAMVRDGAFSVVVTNPPFGTKLQFPAAYAQAEGYAVSRLIADLPADDPDADAHGDCDLGIVFLERAINLLAPGGRMAIVLPDTYLFSPGVRWLVQWLCDNFTITHSINVPIEAFEPHCRAKTSILILPKQRPGPRHRVTGVLTESFGENKHGTPLFRLDAAGRPTAAREDEMAEAVPLLSQSVPEQKLKFTFPQAEAKRPARPLQG